jgi:glycine/D-amino acid oxidase-like deaminating enzyme
MKSKNFDVTIVGAGLSGLTLAKKLGEIGLRVALIERDKQLAAGASTRNQGWLHTGAYHAATVDDRQTAIRIARACTYGYEQISRYAPEAIEDVDLLTFALATKGSSIEDFTSRWDEADIAYRPLTLNQLRDAVPAIVTDGLSGAFAVRDVCVNTRLLCKKLLRDSVRAGASVFSATNITFRTPHEAQLLSPDNELQDIESTLFVYSAGAGIRDLLQAQFSIHIPLRFWKSHLLVFDRLTRNNLFCLASGAANVMNHGQRSIVGLTRDAFECPDHQLDVVADRADEILASLRGLLQLDRTVRFMAYSCIKVDVLEEQMPTVSGLGLGISIWEPIPDHICAIPGKMTAIPYMTDTLTRMIFARIGDNDITLRPHDSWD